LSVLTLASAIARVFCGLEITTRPRWVQKLGRHAATW
jgi:hypothetical protein